MAFKLFLRFLQLYLCRSHFRPVQFLDTGYYRSGNLLVDVNMKGIDVSEACENYQKRAQTLIDAMK